MMRMRAGFSEPRFSDMSVGLTITCTSVQELSCPRGGEDHLVSVVRGGSIFWFVVECVLKPIFVGDAPMIVHKRGRWQPFFPEIARGSPACARAPALRCNRTCCSRRHHRR